MFSSKTLVLVASLSLLGACSAPEPVVYIEGKPKFGTVKLRVSKDAGPSGTTPVSDSFISAEPGRPVPVLNNEELCPERAANLTLTTDTSPCFVSVRFVAVQRESADVEFLLADAYDDAALASASPVKVHLVRNQLTGDVVKVGNYHIAATYLEPLPKPVTLPSTPTNFPLIQRPFGLF